MKVYLRVMKTLEEFVKEINRSEQLQEEFSKIKDIKAIEDFLKRNNCSATAGEFAEYIKNKRGELSDEELSEVSGGLWIMTEYGMIQVDDIPQGYKPPDPPLPIHNIIIEEEE